MLRRAFLLVLLLGALAVSFAGCSGKKADIKAEQHDEVNTEIKLRETRMEAR